MCSTFQCHIYGCATFYFILFVNRIRTTGNNYNFTTVQLQSEEKGELVLTGLNKFTKYAVVIQAFNQVGLGPLSEPIVTQTLEDGKFLYTVNILFVFMITLFLAILERLVFKMKHKRKESPLFVHFRLNTYWTKLSALNQFTALVVPV